MNINNKRLRLESLQEFDVSGQTSQPPYVFEYENVISEKYEAFTIYGYQTLITGGMLKKIQYPTGGYTTYAFEANYGGLGTRISKIENYANSSEKTEYSFQYEEPKTFIRYVGGISYNYPGNSFFITPCAGGGSQVSAGINYLVYYRSRQNLLSESTSDYQVGYGKVTMLVGANGSGGKQVFRYYNDDAVYPPFSAFPLSDFTPLPTIVSSRNGELKMEEDFKKANDSFTKIHDKEYTISVETREQLTIQRYNGYNCNKSYSFSYDRLKTDNIKERTFTDQGNIAKENTQTFAYNNTDVRPISMSVLRSNGMIEKHEYKYPQHFATGGGTIFDKMKAINFIAPVIEEKVTVNSIPTYKYENVFKDWFNNGKSISLEKTQAYKGTSTTPDLTSQILAIDKLGNPLELVSAGNQFKKEVYIWGYEGCLPIMHIIGTGWEDIKDYLNLDILYRGSYNGKTMGDKEMRLQQTNIRSGFQEQKNIQIKTYTYNALGAISSEVDEAGHTTYYEYDKFNRLSAIKNYKGEVLSKFCYNYFGQPIDCYSNSANPYSIAPEWQKDWTTRCETDENDYNTGNVLEYEIDINMNSATFGQGRFVNIGPSLENCPVPVFCTSSDCNLSDPQYRCVYGFCEKGVKVLRSFECQPGSGCECYFYYEWSDGVQSPEYMQVLESCDFNQ